MKKGFEIAADLTEVAVKSQLLTGIAKDIPYVSTLLKVWNLTDSIRDCMFAAKVMRFLESLDDVTGKEREEMSDKIKYLNQEDLDNVTDKILFCIESITDIDKAEFIANLFIAYIYKNISENELRRCIDIVQITFLDDLKHYVTTHLSSQYLTEEDLFLCGVDGLINTPILAPFRDDNRFQSLSDRDKFGKGLFKESAIGVKLKSAFEYGKRTRQYENV